MACIFMQKVPFYYVSVLELGEAGSKLSSIQTVTETNKWDFCNSNHYQFSLCGVFWARSFKLVTFGVWIKTTVLYFKLYGMVSYEKYFYVSLQSCVVLDWLLNVLFAMSSLLLFFPIRLLLFMLYELARVSSFALSYKTTFLFML